MPKRRQVEGRAPTQRVGSDLGNQERQADAERERRRVQCDAPGDVTRSEAIREGLQSRHVGAAEADPREPPDDDRGGEVMGEDAECEGGHGAQR